MSDGGCPNWCDDINDLCESCEEEYHEWLDSH